MTSKISANRKQQRLNQKLNVEDYHHPKEKTNQLLELEFSKCFNFHKKNVLEIFGGEEGYLTAFYKSRGADVTSLTKSQHKSSFDYVYQLRADRKKFGLIDIDSYGYPDKFFPIVFELMEESCLLIFTFPIVGINCVNGIMQQHFYTFYRGIPTIGDVVGQVTDWGLREWFLAKLVDVKKIKRIYRFVFSCERQKATEFCNVKNR